MGAIKATIEAVLLLDKIGIAIGLGGMGALLSGLWASMSKLPPVLIFLCAGMGFAIFFVSFNAVRAFIKHRDSTPHYENWDDLQQLSILQVARLWCERNPLAKWDQRSYAFARLLKEQVRTGKIQKVPGPGLVNIAEIGGDSGIADLIERDELHRLAKNRGERPKFLFKEMR